jgi:hypothetical protein
VKPGVPILAAIAALALTQGNTSAQALDEHVFHYRGGPIPPLRAPMDQRAGGNQSYWTAYWNPDNRITRPGFHVSFWGTGTGCSRIVNGPVSSEGDVFERGRLARNTGLRQSAGSRALRFTPTRAGVAGCREAGPADGDSHIHVNEDPEHGGIGLYTHAGPRPGSDVAAFFQPFPAAGQNGKGDNAHIAGSFVAFRLGRKGDSMRPWSGKAAKGDRRLRVVIRTEQSVARLSKELSDDSKITQVKQQVAVTFANRACLAQRRGGEICQMNFLIHTALWQDIRKPRRERATLMFDPVQGGLPVIYGPLGESGRPTILQGYEDAEAWTSWGWATRSEPFGPARFQAEITFENFISLLRIVAHQKRSSEAQRNAGGGSAVVTLASTTDEHIARLFGAAFRSVEEWFLLDAHFAQEVHSPNPRDRAYIGGSMTELYIAALPR